MTLAHIGRRLVEAPRNPRAPRLSRNPRAPRLSRSGNPHVWSQRDCPAPPNSARKSGSFFAICAVFVARKTRSHIFNTFYLRKRACRFGAVDEAAHKTAQSPEFLPLFDPGFGSLDLTAPGTEPEPIASPQSAPVATPSSREIPHKRYRAHGRETERRHHDDAVRALEHGIGCGEALGVLVAVAHSKAVPAGWPSLKGFPAGAPFARRFPSGP